ncbi:hypothetical protein TNCV_2816381 [Trichonephila clavipes]|nr:hypothetical protein TNCV_2816381 [Trichonephila clavipes]
MDRFVVVGLFRYIAFDFDLEVALNFFELVSDDVGTRTLTHDWTTVATSLWSSLLGYHGLVTGKPNSRLDNGGHELVVITTRLPWLSNWKT